MDTPSFAGMVNGWIIIILVGYLITHVINDRLFIPVQIRRGQARFAVDRMEDARVRLDQIRATVPRTDPVEANPEWLLEQLRR